MDCWAICQGVCMCVSVGVCAGRCPKKVWPTHKWPNANFATSSEAIQKSSWDMSTIKTCRKRPVGGGVSGISHKCQLWVISRNGKRRNGLKRGNIVLVDHSNRFGLYTDSRQFNLGWKLKKKVFYRVLILVSYKITLINFEFRIYFRLGSLSSKLILGGATQMSQKSLLNIIVGVQKYAVN